MIIHRRAVIKDGNAVLVLKQWHHNKVIMINGGYNIYQWSMYNVAMTYAFLFLENTKQCSVKCWMFNVPSRRMR